MLAAIFLMTVTYEGMAAKEEFKKTISKTFDVDKDALLTLKNKFGNALQLQISSG